MKVMILFPKTKCTKIINIWNHKCFLNTPVFIHFFFFAYEIALESASNKEEIENTFMFVQDDSHIVILPPNASGKDFADLIEQLPEDNKYLIQVLKECGTYKSLDEKHTEVEDNATLTEISTKPINLA